MRTVVQIIGGSFNGRRMWHDDDMDELRLTVYPPPECIPFHGRVKNVSYVVERYTRRIICGSKHCGLGLVYAHHDLTNDEVLKLI